LRLNSQYEMKFFLNRRSNVDKRLEKVTRNASSGLQLLSASDNPAGLAISEKTRAQIRGLGQAQRNIQDGIGLLKTVEDGLMKTNEDVQRLYELSVMAANDTMDDQSRAGVQIEVKEILSSIQQTAETVQFNTQNLLGPNNQQDKLNIQIGSGVSETITIDLLDISMDGLGITNASLETNDNAKQLLETTQKIITNISGHLTRFGSQYSALEHNLTNSYTLQNNLTTIESSIRDANMGKETMDLAIGKVLSEALNSFHKFSSDQRQSFEQVLFH
jgi:flagellin